MLTQTAEYAVRSVLFLASQPDRPWTSRAIATSTQVPSRYLARVLQRLAQRGLVDARRGIGGGFTLLADPEALTVLDVLGAVDAMPRRVGDRPEGLAGEAVWWAYHRLVEDAAEEVERRLGSATIAALLRESGAVLRAPAAETSEPTPSM